MPIPSNGSLPAIAYNHKCPQRFWTKARHGPSGTPVGILLTKKNIVVVDV